jgi:hypothetical protein
MDYAQSYNILLQSDVEQMSELCYLDKVYLGICKDLSFWLNKLKQDNLDNILLEYPKTIGEWISVYEKLLYIKDQVKLTFLIQQIIGSYIPDDDPIFIKLVKSIDEDFIRENLPNELKEQIVIRSSMQILI